MSIFPDQRDAEAQDDAEDAQRNLEQMSKSINLDDQQALYRLLTEALGNIVRNDPRERIPLDAGTIGKLIAYMRAMEAQYPNLNLNKGGN